VLKEEDNPDMTNWFYNQPGVSKRRNKYVQPSIGFGPSESGRGHPLHIVRPEVFENIGYKWKRIKRGFIYPRRCLVNVMAFNSKVPWESSGKRNYSFQHFPHC
jgi:hypothetical protein